MLQNYAQEIVDKIVYFTSEALYPVMFLTVGVTFVLKCLVIYTINRQAWFAREFEKRVIRFTDKVDSKQKLSFYMVAKRLLERTYYELFEVRGIMMRRKIDFVSSPIDRLFAIQHGCAWTVKDTLKEIRFLKYNSDTPRFLDISKTVNNANPCFSKLFGWASIGTLNNLLNIIPGLFIISGIFATFPNSRHAAIIAIDDSDKFLFDTRDRVKHCQQN